jgi:hypothetical protein
MPCACFLHALSYSTTMSSRKWSYLSWTPPICLSKLSHHSWFFLMFFCRSIFRRFSLSISSWYSFAPSLSAFSSARHRAGRPGVSSQENSSSGSDGSCAHPHLVGPSGCAGSLSRRQAGWTRSSYPCTTLAETLCRLSGVGTALWKHAARNRHNARNRNRNRLRLLHHATNQTDARTLCLAESRGGVPSVHLYVRRRAPPTSASSPWSSSTPVRSTFSWPSRPPAAGCEHWT